MAATRIEQVAKRFHDLYYGHLRENTGYGFESADFEGMREHKTALMEALTDLDAEGEITIAEEE